MSPETIIAFNVNAGALLFGLVVFVFALLGVVWYGKNEISETIEKKLSPIGRVNNIIGHAITEIQTTLKEKFVGLTFTYNLLEQGSSPLSPTSFGVGLIRDSGLEKILDEKKNELNELLRKKLPLTYTEYDVQEKARELLIELKSDLMMNPLKNWVYNHPNFDIETILRVGGLWLRDDFLGQERRINDKK